MDCGLEPGSDWGGASGAATNATAVDMASGAAFVDRGAATIANCYSQTLARSARDDTRAFTTFSQWDNLGLGSRDLLTEIGAENR